jgi:hypothetical protein
MAVLDRRGEMGGVGDGKVMGGIGEKSRGGAVFFCLRGALVVRLWFWPFLDFLSVWSGLLLAVCLRRWPLLALLSVY